MAPMERSLWRDSHESEVTQSYCYGPELGKTNKLLNFSAHQALCQVRYLGLGHWRTDIKRM